MKTKMLKQDAESSVCTYDKAMRSLPMHTSTQRCDRCQCTHLHSDAIAAHAHMHTQNLHSDTVAVGAYIYTTIRSLPFTHLHRAMNIMRKSHTASNVLDSRLATVVQTNTRPTRPATPIKAKRVVWEYTPRSIRSLPMHMPAQRYDRSF